MLQDAVRHHGPFYHHEGSTYAAFDARGGRSHVQRKKTARGLRRPCRGLSGADVAPDRLCLLRGYTSPFHRDRNWPGAHGAADAHRGSGLSRLPSGNYEHPHTAQFPVRYLGILIARRWIEVESRTVVTALLSLWTPQAARWQQFIQTGVPQLLNQGGAVVA